jgi:hypothetical protein
VPSPCDESKDAGSASINTDQDLMIDDISEDTLDFYYDAVSQQCNSVESDESRSEIFFDALEMLDTTRDGESS